MIQIRSISLVLVLIALIGLLYYIFFKSAWDADAEGTPKLSIPKQDGINVASEKTVTLAPSTEQKLTALKSEPSNPIRKEARDALIAWRHARGD